MILARPPNAPIVFIVTKTTHFPVFFLKKEGVLVGFQSDNYDVNLLEASLM